MLRVAVTPITIAARAGPLVAVYCIDPNYIGWYPYWNLGRLMSNAGIKMLWG